MNTLQTTMRSSLVWLLPLVVVLLLIGWQTGWGEQWHRMPPANAVVTPQPVTVAVLPEYSPGVGPQDSRDIVERTLFNPTRRPAPSAVAEAAKPRMQRGQFALSGTMVVDGKATAFLREVSGGKSRRVAQGETVNGMVVADVKPDRVKLTQGDESEELALKLAAGPKTTIQPQVAGAPPAPGAPRPTAPGMAGLPGMATAAAPAPQVRDVNEVLTERRRAARAAEAAAAGQPPGAAVVAQPPVQANTVQAAPATPAAAPDPQWQGVYQRYQQPRR